MVGFFADNSVCNLFFKLDFELEENYTKDIFIKYQIDFFFPDAKGGVASDKYA